MKRILLITMTIACITILNAEGPLQMKGFHHDIPFDKACKILSTFKTDRGEFLLKEKDKKCGFGRNGFISYPHILGNIHTDNIKSIVLSPEVVDTLFEAKGVNVNKFSKVFLKRYRWIDTFRTRGIYRQESIVYGWSLSINKKKWLKITFFDN